MSRERWGHTTPLDPEGRCSGGIWYGVRVDLEDEADRIIFDHLATITRAADKSDVLTPWKVSDRRRREEPVGRKPARSSPGEVTRDTDGAPERTLLEGFRWRASNPLHSYLNGRPRGVASGEKPATANLGVGRVFGGSLNTPSLWINGKDPELPTSATGVKGN